MALGICIPDLIEQGKLSGERAARARQLYDELVMQHERRFGRAEAEAMATRQTIDALERDTLARKRQTLLQARAQQRIAYQARAVFDGGSGRDGPISGRALLAHLVRDEKARGIANVEFRWRNIKQQALGRIYSLIERHRPGLTGEVRDKAGLDDVVRELFGQDSANPNAREIAEAWRGAAEWLRQRFNAAGGTIGKLDTWALPQSHDPLLVGALSRDQWIERIWPDIDRARMIDRMTDQPMSDARLLDVLGQIYENIVSEGWNSRSPGAAGERAFANRHAEQRILHFRDADTWLAYQQQFGAGNAFDAMMAHIETMARDIAAMEILGPNPAATIRWMADMATKEAAEAGSLADRAAARVDGFRINRVWQEIQGENRRVVGRKLALFGSTVRNWQTSTRLGSATLASMSDHATRLIVRRYNGLPETKAMGAYLKQLAHPEFRDFVRRAGVISDEFTGRMSAHGRLHFEEAFGGRLAPDAAGIAGRTERALERSAEYSRRLADGVLRASGLNAHTVAGREAVAMEFFNALMHYAPRSWGELRQNRNGRRWRRLFERYGMGESEWNALRSAPTVEWRGLQWITPDSIEAHAGAALRDRWMEAVLTETEFAVPTGGLYLRSMVHFAPPGTWIGEVIRTGFQFKMFPVTVVMLHGARAMAQADIGRMAGYATGFLAATTLAGALAYQLGEMAKGRDPMPMTGWPFWWRAMQKGGGGGIYVDAIAMGTNEYGQTVGDITKGPSWTSGQTIIDSVGAIAQSVTANDAESERRAGAARQRAVRALAREVPGSSLWYVRAAYERLLVDQLAAMVDPDGASDATARMAERAMRNGQRYFVPPGGSLSDVRAPDLGNVMAPPPEAR